MDIKELFQEQEKHKGKCECCNGPLELYEVDYEKKTRILICKQCNLSHFYRQTLFGWKIVKVKKIPV